MADKHERPREQKSYLVGDWHDAVIDISADDDLSGFVDLGEDFAYLQVILPTLDSCTMYVQIAPNEQDSYTELPNSRNVGTGGYPDVFILGGFRFIKLRTSVSQSSDRTVKVRGWRGPNG